MKKMCVDIETYSSIDLKTSGVYAYAGSPDFEILLFGYAFDDEEITVLDLTQNQLPKEIEAALLNPDILKTAFNANFERTCLAAYLGCPMPAEQWDCTAVMARELGLPASLADVGKVLGLPEEQQKLKSGSALIRYFSIPCKPTKTNGQRTRNLPAHDMDKWALYKEYNAGDVEAERAIRRILEKYPIDIKEKPLWVADQNISDRGVRCDLDFAENAISFDERILARLTEEAKTLTGLENPNSTAQLKGWIEDETGLEVDSIAKSALKELRQEIDSEKVHRVLDLREGLSKTSTAKYGAMVRAACDDGRIRGLTQFYGANRTGRWAGRIVQMQNLPRNQIPDRDLDIARQLVDAGKLEDFELLFDDIPYILSQLIRTAFIPKEGHEFIVADFSAIEARVIAWMAGERWRMEVFKSHGKIYEASAEQMFNLPTGSVKKGDPMRDKGKVAELALGYGGSVGALIAMNALNMGLKEEELKPLVNTWRAANKAITKFWWDCDGAMRDTLMNKTRVTLKQGVTFYLQGPLLRIQLPSGRSLSYVKPRIRNDKLMYEGNLKDSGGWGLVDTYGPKIVENIVQAVARDCLAVAIMRLETKGIPVVFHVHDEVIVEVPKGKYTPEEISDIMGQPIDWAKGLPLRADAYRCDYYRKD